MKDSTMPQGPTQSIGGPRVWVFEDLPDEMFWISVATAGIGAACAAVLVDRQRPGDDKLDRIGEGINQLITVLERLREAGDAEMDAADALLGDPDDVAETPEEAGTLYGLRALWVALGKEDGLGRETPRP